jgi:ABC-type methionine transport system ATPase subunit
MPPSGIPTTALDESSTTPIIAILTVVFGQLGIRALVVITSSNMEATRR